MIDRGHALPITRQAQLLGMSRGAVYYMPRPTRSADLALASSCESSSPSSNPACAVLLQRKWSTHTLESARITCRASSRPDHIPR
jgi:hypothetical protein